MSIPDILTIADLNRSPQAWIGAVAGVASVLVLRFLVRSAQKDTELESLEKTVSYPFPMRVLVTCFWLILLGFYIAVGFLVRQPSQLAALLLVALFSSMVVPLHLEIFGVSIDWDDKNIYTKSPWRKSRTIPFDSVTGCDFSRMALWYRIYTKDSGLIRLHLYMCGIPRLLEALPCTTPPYPPKGLG
jgi:hypothetical protein